jgi:hypothetical protein
MSKLFGNIKNQTQLENEMLRLKLKEKELEWKLRDKADHFKGNFLHLAANSLLFRKTGVKEEPKDSEASQTESSGKWQHVADRIMDHFLDRLLHGIDGVLDRLFSGRKEKKDPD